MDYLFLSCHAVLLSLDCQFLRNLYLTFWSVSYMNKVVIEEGSHSELMALNGKYAEMFHIQSNYYEKGEIA